MTNQQPPLYQKKLHNRIVGKEGEDKAVKYLSEHGFEIIDRNYRTKYGEIDIVAVKDNTLCCVEVKTRTSTKYGYPHEAISPSKLRRMELTAQLCAAALRYKGATKLLLVEVLNDSVALTEVEY